MASIPEFDTPEETELDPSPAEVLSSSLMGTVVDAYNDPSSPGVYLRYADGSIMQVIADAQRVQVILAAPSKKTH